MHTYIHTTYIHTHTCASLSQPDVTLKKKLKISFKQTRKAYSFYSFYSFYYFYSSSWMFVPSDIIQDHYFI